MHDCDGENSAAGATVAAFDLLELSGLTAAQEEGFDVAITHPKTGESLGITVKVAGPDSKRAKKVRAILIQERSDMKIRKASEARLDDESNRISAASIISWSGVVVAGKAWEYSAQNAHRLVAQFPFIRDQIDTFVGDRANFIRS